MVMKLLVYHLIYHHYLSPRIILSHCFQPRSQLHRRIRRRCLDFERAGSCERKPNSECNGSSSVSVNSNGKVASVENNLVQIKNDSFCSGVGLHLNDLAPILEEKEVKIETLACESQLVSTPRSIVYSYSLMPVESSRDKFSPQKSMESDLILYNNGGQAVEDAHQTPKCAIGGEFDHISAQDRRHA